MCVRGMVECVDSHTHTRTHELSPIRTTENLTERRKDGKTESQQPHIRLLALDRCCSELGVVTIRNYSVLSVAATNFDDIRCERVHLVALSRQCCQPSKFYPQNKHNNILE